MNYRLSWIPHVGTLFLLVATSAAAQEGLVGRTAESSVGQVGQRQRQAASNDVPTGRIRSRIVNRVQSRIRNRIDRNYDPQANATSPFVVAGEQASGAGR